MTDDWPLGDDLRQLYPDASIVLEQKGIEHDLPDEDEATLTTDGTAIRLSSSSGSWVYYVHGIDEADNRVVVHLGGSAGTTPLGHPGGPPKAPPSGGYFGE